MAREQTTGTVRSRRPTKAIRRMRVIMRRTIDPGMDARMKAAQPTIVLRTIVPRGSSVRRGLRIPVPRGTSRVRKARLARSSMNRLRERPRSVTKVLRHRGGKARHRNAARTLRVSRAIPTRGGRLGSEFFFEKVEDERVVGAAAPSTFAQIIRQEAPQGLCALESLDRSRAISR